MSTITKKKLNTKKKQRTFKKGPPAARIRSIGGISILDACMDPNLFRPWFAKPAMKTWNSWFAFLNASFGLPMTPEQKQVYFDCTGRDKLLTRPVKEVYLCTGRRGGKSRVLALVAVYLACFYDWSPYLSPGEYGTIAIMASDRRQARTIFRYIYAFLTEVPLLKDRLAKEPTKESLELRGNIVIEIQTASYRSARGYTVIAALMDEIAFFRSDESSNPDTEILEAVLPGMSTIPHSMLLCASSPYARKGVLYQAYRDYFGKDDPNALFWKAPTWTMNPTIAPSIIERAYARDPAKASAEYGAEFRKDVETAISLEVIQAATDNGLEERLPSNAHHYVAFVDASGGSKDSFTMSIAHAEGQHRVIDYIYEKAPPFSPRDVIYEISSILKRYNISYVVGDRYAGEFPREHFRECGIMYETSSKPKAELYADFISMINSGQVRLLDNQKMARQFQELERKSRVGGRDVIDHPPGGHDDLANVVAGVCSCIDSVGLADIW